MRPAFLLSVLLAVPLWAQEPEAVRRKLVADLEELARWCTTENLVQERNLVYGLILHFDPGHAPARDGLRAGARGRKEAVAEFERRRDLAARTFARPLLDLVAAGRGSPEERRRWLRDALVVDPGNSRARDLNREVKAGDKWVLFETLEARGRRENLDTWMGLWRTSVALEGYEELPKEPEGKWWKVLGRVPEEDRCEALGTAEAANLVFAGHLGASLCIRSRALARRKFVLHLFANDNEGKAVLANYPSVPGMTRRKTSGWVKPNRLVLWTEPEARSEEIARQVMAALLHIRYGITAKSGWAMEGLAVYLGHALRGSRPIPEAQENPPELLALTAKTDEQMTGADRLRAYALAAYLIEARYQELSVLLEDVGKGATFGAAVREHLKMDHEGLQERLDRWIRERE